MDELSVFMKTEMAAEEIRNRTYKLSQKMRSLLIMIDGKKPVSSLIEIAGGLGDVPVILTELENQGFIVKRAVAPKAVPAVEEPAESSTDEIAKKATDAVYDDGRGYFNI